MFEQEGGHISPSQPSSPHPPGIRLRDSPFSQPGPRPLPEAPASAAVGPRGRLPRPPALQPVLLRGSVGPPTSPCPAGHRGSSNAGSDRTKWESEPVRGTSSRPRLIGASGRAGGTRGCGARRPPAPQRSGAGPGPRRRLAQLLARPSLSPFLLALPGCPEGVSTLLRSLSPPLPFSGLGPAMAKAAGAR